jgi:hypothetical protein
MEKNEKLISDRESQEDQNAWLNEQLETEQIGQFLKKTMYAGRNFNCKILGVEKNSFSPDKKKDLIILIDGEEMPLKMGLSAVDLNDLIMLLGRTPASWIGKRVNIKFSDVKKWQVGNLNKEGCTSKITLNFD